MLRLEDVWNFIFYLFLGLIPLLVFAYFYLTSTFDHWKKKGVDHIKPSFPFGNLGDVMMGRKSLTDLTIEQYTQFEGKPYFGIFNFTTPVLVLKDPSIVERVLMTDFAHFCDRGEDNLAPENDPFNYYIGNLSGDTWRQLRHKINGAFSNSKLKRMTELISFCANFMLEHIAGQVAKKESIYLDCLGYGFSHRVIAKCAFGIECDEYGVKEFIVHVKKIFLKMKVVHMIILSHIYTPRLIKFLYMIPPVDKVVQYFKTISLETIRVRQGVQVKRNDFLQVLLDLREEEIKENRNDAVENTTTVSSYRKSSTGKGTLEKKCLFTENMIMSQMFMFMSLGMETTAVAVTFIFLDLATNAEVQAKVQEEIDSVVDRYGELSYEATQQLNYLDLVIQESLRLHPGFPYLHRVCVSPYRVPGSELTLEKGTTILIPSCAIHLDPGNYHEPQVFNPERFLDNNYKPSPTYLPFGVGPRMCIAVKLVILELKLAVAKVMQRYSVKLKSETPLPPKYAPTFMPKLLQGLWAEFTERPHS
ncbi:cytochrome P450 9e2-like [Macrosteles quadrilineatus]|uniref:cytochrome P450 9e2-like n=1 Tax=Macrosteles quadrilineatus TaxID=74068 RepID=UPI0023E1858A|nr:cytochrome P450 9e2-like [Macrosteles quadrilineatus]